MREHFSYTVSSTGYMIQFKGKNIGGAGIIGKYKGRGRAKQVQIQSYKEQAERDIDELCNGRGQKRYRDILNSID